MKQGGWYFIHPLSNLFIARKLFLSKNGCKTVHSISFKQNLSVVEVVTVGSFLRFSKRMHPYNKTAMGISEKRHTRILRKRKFFINSVPSLFSVGSILNSKWEVSIESIVLHICNPKTGPLYANAQPAAQSQFAFESNVITFDSKRSKDGKLTSTV